VRAGQITIAYCNLTLDIDQGAIYVAKSHLKLVPPATVNRTVAPLRRKNADLRSREHLTEAEVKKLPSGAMGPGGPLS
jgi:hypothetical protein